jgi:hypothetical protein
LILPENTLFYDLACCLYQFMNYQSEDIYGLIYITPFQANLQPHPWKTSRYQIENNHLGEIQA